MNASQTSDISAATHTIQARAGRDGMLQDSNRFCFFPGLLVCFFCNVFSPGRGGGKGCFWNQDVEALCLGAGLTVVRSSPALLGGLFRTLECVPAREA